MAKKDKKLWLKCPHCKKPAFYFYAVPFRTEIITHEHVYVDEGKVDPVSHDIMRCQNCGEKIMVSDLIEENLVKEV